MTFLDETRYHYFSLDSDQDLSASVLELSTDTPAVWVTASHTTAPPSAANFPAPQAGLTRYWWRALFGPGESLSLLAEETTVSGHLTNAPEELYPVWTIFEEDPDPVVPHCWPIDVSCLGTTWNQYPAEVQQKATMLAVETLRVLTGYRVGGCPVTVRPCRPACLTTGTWAVYPVTTTGALVAPIRGWLPALASGQWLNVGCSCPADGCSCAPLCEIRLPGAVGAIEEVTVDGAVLDPSAYRVDNGNLLVRVDGDCWPTCQDMTLAPTEPDTFAVTYTQGAPPGDLGAVAAGALAGEYAKACAGDDCALPPNVRQVSRQGVTLDLAGQAGDYWPNGLTGIREVDLFIRRWNPHALRGPSTVWSPDLVRRSGPRRTT